VNAVGQLVVTTAVTVRLPWAAAIRPDLKLVENRGRPIPAKHIGTRVGIHAGAAWSKDGGEDPRIRSWWWGRTWAHRAPLQATDFPTYFRHVISVARVADCHQADRRGPYTCCRPWGDPYYVDPGKAAWHVVFDDVTPIEPVGPVKGSLLVPWTLPPAIAAQVTIRYLDAP
jgi:hypothetical protein